MIKYFFPKSYKNASIDKLQQKYFFFFLQGKYVFTKLRSILFDAIEENELME